LLYIHFKPNFPRWLIVDFFRYYDVENNLLNWHCDYMKIPIFVLRSDFKKMVARAYTGHIENLFSNVADKVDGLPNEIAPP
jgi:hypothetical protein